MQTVLAAVHTLAWAAAQLKWAARPNLVRAQVRDLFADTLAVIAGGMGHPSHHGFADA